jgi:hypothetical protein
MNNPAASYGVSELCHENYLQGLTPGMFLTGVQSEHPPGFPLKARGNDGLRRGDSLNCGESTQRDRFKAEGI